VAWIFGHGPKRQKHVSDLIVAFVTGCKAPGFLQTKKLRGNSLNVLYFKFFKGITNNHMNAKNYEELKWRNE
jgi:hypothetical protein